MKCHFLIQRNDYANEVAGIKYEKKSDQGWRSKN